MPVTPGINKNKKNLISSAKISFDPHNAYMHCHNSFIDAPIIKLINNA